jgi:quercetin dioxygenase-like cupin family protein
MTTPRQAKVLGPGAGRRYEMGALTADFKADGAETANAYSVSEWHVAPGAPGPGAHDHEANDDMFYVLEGTASFLVGDDWIEAPEGSFVCAPAGVRHDFANRTDRPLRLLNIFVPGGFEDAMPAIVAWFRDNG